MKRFTYVLCMAPCVALWLFLVVFTLGAMFTGAGFKIVAMNSGLTFLSALLGFGVHKTFMWCVKGDL